MTRRTGFTPTIALTTGTIVEDESFGQSELDTVLVKVASRCNINCTYCYVYNMGDDNWMHLPKFMSEETIQALCEALLSLTVYQKRLFSVVLHGGEPFLLGAERLKFLLSKLRVVLPDEYPISIQSNGILITDDILNICSFYKASIAISIDGPKHIHDKNRVTHGGNGTFDKVLAGFTILKSHPDASFLNAGLLAVIDPFSDAREVYQFFKSIQAPSVDFLYKDGNHSKLPFGKASFNSVEYGAWMTELVNVYLNDEDPLPIRVLDDMLKVLLGGEVSKEGLGVTDFGIIIIDSDGTVMKNDTLKSAHNGADKFEKPININQDNLLHFINSEEFNAYKESQRPTCVKCLNCPELNLCGGGMILHRWSDSNGYDNPSIYCSDQLYLINSMRNNLSKILIENS